jgi:hypothetical protein
LTAKNFSELLEQAPNRIIVRRQVIHVGLTYGRIGSVDITSSRRVPERVNGFETPLFMSLTSNGV